METWIRGQGYCRTPDFFDHIAPCRNASPKTPRVPRVMHRGQHPVASANVSRNKAGFSVVLAGLDATKSNCDLRVCGED
jgi:hypothetical protein